MNRLVSLSVVALLSLPAAAFAQPGWDTIGFRTVGAGSDRDEIRVRGRDRHRQIRICAINRPIQLKDLDVRFANRGRQDIRVRQFLRAGACTAAKDLKGRARNLQSVRITYAQLRRGMIPPLVRVQAR
jgi:hypothetical protein